MDSTTTVKLITAAIFIGAGLFLAAISVPFIQRKVKPNKYWGFIRTRRMVENADVWYPVNAYAGRLMVGVAVVQSICAIVLLVVPGLSPATYIFVLTGLLVALVLGLVILTFRYLSQH